MLHGLPFPCASEIKHILIENIEDKKYKGNHLTGVQLICKMSDFVSIFLLFVKRDQS